MMFATTRHERHKLRVALTTDPPDAICDGLVTHPGGWTGAHGWIVHYYPDQQTWYVPVALRGFWRNLGGQQPEVSRD